MRRERERLQDAQSYTGRLPASLRDCIMYMRGLGGMSGMVSEHGKMEAAFGPMGSAAPSGPTATPTHFYRLEDTNWTDTGTGTQLDLSASGTAPTSSTGHIGNAAYFNSSVPHILTRADHADFEIGSGDYTVWGWVYLVSKSTQYGLMGKISAYFSNYEWMAQNTGGSPSYLGFYVSNTGSTAAAVGVLATTYGGVPAATWFFFALRRNASTNIQISANGGAWNTTNFANNVYAGAAPYYLGCRGYNSGSPLDPLNGRMDALAFFKSAAVSDDDVIAGYNSGTGLEYYSGAWQ